MAPCYIAYVCVDGCAQLRDMEKLRHAMPFYAYDIYIINIFFMSHMQHVKAAWPLFYVTFKGVILEVTYK